MPASIPGGRWRSNRAGTARARDGMKNTTLMIGFVVAAALASALPRGGEAPSATDLLRAEKLAEQAQKRLRQPARSTARWAHGGSGFGDGPRERPAEESPVVINVRPPRERKSSR